jgi:hypothetical protein
MILGFLHERKVRAIHAVSARPSTNNTQGGRTVKSKASVNKSTSTPFALCQ